MDKAKFTLKHMDDDVMHFDISSMSVSIVNEGLLPFSIKSCTRDFSMVRKFCGDRLLTVGRKHYKEILRACGINDQSDIGVCLICKGLSLRDSYWLSEYGSNYRWRDVNLYDNELNLSISKTSVAGVAGGIGENSKEGGIFTGELTSKGTKAKGYFRDSRGILLYKVESPREINVEIVSGYVAKAFKISSSKYWKEHKFDKECSVCKICTSEVDELIPCRDILSYCNEISMHTKSNYYRLFMKVDALNFIKMHIFDYVTLNTDRNRDNFGIHMHDGVVTGMYELFDHDSCFKGRSTRALYFPTGMKFIDTLNMLKSDRCLSQAYNAISGDIAGAKKIITSDSFKSLFLKYMTDEDYVGLVSRVMEL